MAKMQNFVKNSKGQAKTSDTGQKVNAVMRIPSTGSSTVKSAAKSDGGKMVYANYPNHLMGQGECDSDDFGQMEGKQESKKGKY